MDPGRARDLAFGISVSALALFGERLRAQVHRRSHQGLKRIASRISGLRSRADAGRQEGDQNDEGCACGSHDHTRSSIHRREGVPRCRRRIATSPERCRTRIDWSRSGLRPGASGSASLAGPHALRQGAWIWRAHWADAGGRIGSPRLAISSSGCCSSPRSTTASAWRRARQPSRRATPATHSPSRWPFVIPRPEPRHPRYRRRRRGDRRRGVARGPPAHLGDPGGLGQICHSPP